MKFFKLRVLDRRISKVAVPALADTFVMSIAMLINTAFIGSIGKEALAAIGLIRFILHSFDFISSRFLYLFLPL